MYYDEYNLLRKNTKYFEFSLQTHIRHANVRRYITHTANWRIPNLAPDKVTRDIMLWCHRDGLFKKKAINSILLFPAAHCRARGGTKYDTVHLITGFISYILKII